MQKIVKSNFVMKYTFTLLFHWKHFILLEMRCLVLFAVENGYILKDITGGTYTRAFCKHRKYICQCTAESNPGLKHKGIKCKLQRQHAVLPKWRFQKITFHWESWQMCKYNPRTKIFGEEMCFMKKHAIFQWQSSC